MNHVEQALARAKQMKEEAAASPGGLPVPAPANDATAPSIYQPTESYSVSTLDSFLKAPARPDDYLKVNGGLMLGKATGVIFPELFFALEGGNNGATMQRTLRFGEGAGTKYIKSYDGAVCSPSGENFPATVQRIKQQYGGKAAVYESVDLIFQAAHDIVNPNTKAVILEAGQRVGYAPPPTGTDDFRGLAQEVSRVVGVPINDPGLVILVRLGARFTSKNNNNWWNVSMNLAGVFDVEKNVWTPIGSASEGGSKFAAAA